VSRFAADRYFGDLSSFKRLASNLIPRQQYEIKKEGSDATNKPLVLKVFKSPAPPPKERAALK
jgi:hypothetical protein